MGQIEDLKLYTLVVENRSISGAADKLHIAKSAVSRRLSLLEERFGTRLINRESGIWEVTTAGRELYQRAVRVVNDVDEIENDFSEAARNLAGPLTISVPRDYGIAYLNTDLLAFQERHPEIQLTVDFDDRKVDLTRENYDFAIRITPNLDDNVVTSQIGTSHHQFCASPAYLASQGQPYSLDALQDHSLLHYGAARRAQWDAIGPSGKLENITFQPSLNSNSGEFLLKAAVNGMGIVRLPDFILAPALTSGDLVPILTNITDPEWGIYLVHSEDRRLNRRMRLFSEEITKSCQVF